MTGPDQTRSAALRHPHLQTVVSSIGRRWSRRAALKSLERVQRRVVLTTADGVRLESFVNLQPEPAPLAIVIAGWLGCHTSTYVTSLAHGLWTSGFSVARLNLRDHGGSAGLNEDLFNSARLDEVVDACAQLSLMESVRQTGLIGFSLGGNFAIRVAGRLDLETVAVCPAIDPATTMQAIDNGPAMYRLWFVRKWHRALRAKADAFPDRYDFSSALGLSGVGPLTDYFVSEHSEFRNTADYFAAYDLRHSPLPDNVLVVATEDDPIVPYAALDTLAPRERVATVETGGHCGFLANWRLDSHLDPWAVGYFQERLRT